MSDEENAFASVKARFEISKSGKVTFHDKLYNYKLPVCDLGKAEAWLRQELDAGLQAIASDWEKAGKPIFPNPPVKGVEQPPEDTDRIGLFMEFSADFIESQFPLNTQE